MAVLTKYQKSTSYATWTDVNPIFNPSAVTPLVLSDAQSVLKCSVYALLNCMIGERAGIFEPEYGSALPYYLQEPIDGQTAEDIRMSLYTTFEKWEPRIEVRYEDILVEPDYTLPGYYVKVSAKYKPTQELVSQEFMVTKQ